MQTWLQRKTDVLLKRKNLLGQHYSQRMIIPLDSYDSLNPVIFNNISTALRVVRDYFYLNNIVYRSFFLLQGTIPLLTVPNNIEQTTIKCSDNNDKIITNRFNSKYRLTVSVKTKIIFGNKKRKVLCYHRAHRRLVAAIRRIEITSSHIFY